MGLLNLEDKLGPSKKPDVLPAKTVIVPELSILLIICSNAHVIYILLFKSHIPDVIPEPSPDSINNDTVPDGVIF